MNSSLFIFFVSIIVPAVNAFHSHTTLSGARNGSGMTMRARECDLLKKKANRKARVVTFSHKRNKKVQHVNLQSKRYFSEELGRNVRVRLSTKGMKTVDKYGGIDAAAKKFGLDLSQY